MEKEESVTDVTDTEFSLLQKGALWLLFIGSSFLVFNVAGYNSFIPVDLILLTRICVVGILLVPTFILFRMEGAWNKYWKLSFSFWIASIGLLLAWLFGRWYNLIPGLSTSTLEGVAVAKVAEVLPIVLAILIGTWLVERDYSPIFVRGGDLRKSLMLGIVALPSSLFPFVVLGGLSLSVGLETIVSGLPWLCAFSFSNAFMEELMIRGLFLKKYDTIFGQKQSLFLTSIIFAIFHLDIIGITDFLSFLGYFSIPLIMGLIWGYIIQRSDSIWGSVFAHAIADIFFVLVLFGP